MLAQASGSKGRALLQQKLGHGRPHPSPGVSRPPPTRPHPASEGKDAGEPLPTSPGVVSGEASDDLHEWDRPEGKESGGPAGGSSGAPPAEPRAALASATGVEDGKEAQEGKTSDAAGDEVHVPSQRQARGVRPMLGEGVTQLPSAETGEGSPVPSLEGFQRRPSSAAASERAREEEFASDSEDSVFMEVASSGGGPSVGASNPAFRAMLMDGDGILPSSRAGRGQPLTPASVRGMTWAGAGHSSADQPSTGERWGDSFQTATRLPARHPGAAERDSQTFAEEDFEDSVEVLGEHPRVLQSGGRVQQAPEVVASSPGSGRDALRDAMGSRVAEPARASKQPRQTGRDDHIGGKESEDTAPTHAHVPAHREPEGEVPSAYPTDAGLPPRAREVPEPLAEPLPEPKTFNFPMNTILEGQAGARQGYSSSSHRQPYALVGHGGEMVVKVPQGTGELELTAGKQLRRCVQKGWLRKRPESGEWFKGWKRRYFRVVVHTQVVPIHADNPYGFSLDERIQTAMLHYYTDEDPSTEAKATVPLIGCDARMVTNAQVVAKNPYCFQITHPRRRTYYLDPVLPPQTPPEDAEAVSQNWVRIVNASIQTTGDLFVMRFKRQGQGPPPTAPTVPGAATAAAASPYRDAAGNPMGSPGFRPSGLGSPAPAAEDSPHGVSTPGTGQRQPTPSAVYGHFGQQ